MSNIRPFIVKEVSYIGIWFEMYRTFSQQFWKKNQKFSRYLLLGSTSVVSACNYSATRSVTFLERKKDDEQSTNASPKEEEPYSFFNVSDWKLNAKNSSELWSKIWTETETSAQQQESSSRKKDVKVTGTKEGIEADFTAMAGNFLKLFGGGKEQQEEAISEIVAKARETSAKSDVSDERSFSDLLDALDKYRLLIHQVADKYVSSIDFSKFDPTSLFYYLEYQDEVKNPSWKRRKHRFYEGIDIEKVELLNEFLDLAKISYADTVEEIKQGLEYHAQPCELIHAEVNSLPGKPANFVAIPRNQPRFSNQLEVIIGVRGTKTLSDAITDLICEDVEYRGGKAHSFIVNSGKFIFEKHLATLEELLALSGKSKIKLRLVGHSLGAGAASIAGIEFNDHPKFDVEVVGFGCPALLSKELATSTAFITVCWVN